MGTDSLLESLLDIRGTAAVGVSLLSKSVCSHCCSCRPFRPWFSSHRENQERLKCLLYTLGRTAAVRKRHR